MTLRSTIYDFEVRRALFEPAEHGSGLGRYMAGLDIVTNEVADRIQPVEPHQRRELELELQFAPQPDLEARPNEPSYAIAAGDDWVLKALVD